MHLITPFKHFFQHSSCAVELCLNCFWIFAGALSNLGYRQFQAEMSISHFFIRTLQLHTQCFYPGVGICQHILIFGRSLLVRELKEVCILRGNTAPSGSFQMIQTFPDCNLAEPGFFVSTIKTGEILVGGKKNILCQILGVKWIAHRFQTNRKY